MSRLPTICCCGWIIFITGCAAAPRSAVLPTENEVVREQLIVHSDFYVPRQHRILDDLVARRSDLANAVNIEPTDEPIHVFLFSDKKSFSKFMKRNHPAFQDRRAIFVENDTTLMVYASWGPQVAEDLRHEVTHGYLHSVVPAIPLWLDEGLAEYFETPRGSSGLNRPHVRMLAQAYRNSQWTPDLARLESLDEASQLSQLDYAQSWLWVHFLLHEDAQTNSILAASLRDCKETGAPTPLEPNLRSYLPDCDVRLLGHLKSLADSL